MLTCVSGQCPLFVDVYHHGEEERGANVLRVELVTKLAHSRELTQLVTTKDTKKSHSMTLDQAIQLIRHTPAGSSMGSHCWELSLSTPGCICNTLNIIDIYTSEGWSSILDFSL